MYNQDYNNAENAVERTGDAIQNAANSVKWKTEEYADRAKDYIREQRQNNVEPTAEGWMERAKDNVSDAWESTKDAVSDAWDKTKDWADDAWDATKDAAEDVKSEVNKATN